MSRALRAVLTASCLATSRALWTSSPQVILAQPTTMHMRTTNDTTKYWFNFGDSYSETGFSINGTAPSPGNPMGNPPYPGRTASSDGGANWIGFLTTKYNSSETLTYNFAWGGATINRSVIAPTQDISYDDQVRNFTWWNGAYGSTVGWTSDDSLFSSWIGINDIKMSYSLGGNRSEFYDQLLEDEFNLIEELRVNLLSPNWVYAKIAYSGAGARNWLFLNIPPIDRTPEMLRESEANQDLQRLIVEVFNLKLAAKVKEFADSHANVTIWSFDSHSLFTMVLDNPKKYGFIDATSEGTGSFWGNSYHPSSPAQELIAQKVGALLADIPW